MKVFTYCLINLGLMLVAVLLQRKTFMVFGAIGVYSYLGHLAFDVFRKSLLFPAALTALGIAIIAAGVWDRSREGAVEAGLLRVLAGGVGRAAGGGGVEISGVGGVIKKKN